RFLGPVMLSKNWTIWFIIYFISFDLKTMFLFFKGFYSFFTLGIKSSLPVADNGNKGYDEDNEYFFYFIQLSYENL
uniref:hypothetical protein n=1 Tax=Capnocytophaga gingivalis TaxID=1017 RepID=UPI0028D7EB11